MKRGFTLVELLAVITILSLIALIASISVANLVKNSKEELSDAQIKSIQIAAESWASDNVKDLPTGDNCTFILLKDLKEEGLLDSNLKDLKSKNDINNEIKIKITSNGKKLEYKVDSKDVDECTYIGSNMYVDLPEGLTPVLYDDKLNSWRVPNVNEEWYNYNKQEWANAVVLGQGKSKKPGETVKVDGTEALMMLVYVPRYEYKIEGQYGKHYSDKTDGTQELPGEIKVKFVNTNQTKADEDYIMHPAFTFGEQEVSGIWVGKFEISSVGENLTSTNNLGCNQNGCTSDVSNLRILPNVPSLRYNNVSNFWYGIKAIENTSSFGLTNIDTHMMKNSEWGAVAYLSQSKYGKYGNNDYIGAQKEVYQNKSSAHITGNSNGTPSQSEYREDSQCTYADTINNCGVGASTTGNIYGVYDMSGGSYEYVMGVYVDSVGKIYTGSSNEKNSGFNGWIYNEGNEIEKNDGVDFPNPKYYDIYFNPTNLEFNDGRQSCNKGICYGHTLSETIRWYNDWAYMVNSNYPWFLRGADYGNLASYYPGIFSSAGSSGLSSASNSTRVVGFRNK